MTPTPWHFFFHPLLGLTQGGGCWGELGVNLRAVWGRMGHIRGVGVGQKEGVFLLILKGVRHGRRWVGGIPSHLKGGATWGKVGRVCVCPIPSKSGWGVEGRDGAGDRHKPVA